MKRPSFQFYPGDWRNNANLRRCSPAARGVWMDVLCTLHDADEYGVVPWPLAELANASSAPLRYVRELVDKRVLKGTDSGTVDPFIYVPRSGRREGAPVVLIDARPGPLWYSSRMVRDEYVRTIRGESSRFVAEDNPSPKTAPKPSPKVAPKPPLGDGASSSSSSSPSGKENSEANASAAKPPGDLTKAELWQAGKSLLVEAGVPAGQCGSFVGKLVSDYGDAVVLDAVRSAVLTTPADPREYLKATCQRLKGERVSPATVPSRAAEATAAFLAEKRAHDEQAERERAARKAAGVSPISILRARPGAA